jgi:hypothetical protein
MSSPRHTVEERSAVVEASAEFSSRSHAEGNLTEGMLVSLHDNRKMLQR